MLKVGKNFNIAKTASGDVYSWGFNNLGQLGLDHNYNQNIPQQIDFFKDKQIKEIKCGDLHTFAITDSSEVYSWGYNNNGQLGLGHNNNQKNPQLVDFFKNKQIKEIICGSFHTLAITENNEVYSWGSNYNGQLGLGHNDNQNIPQLAEFFKDKPVKKIICSGSHTIAVTDSDDIYSWGWNYRGQLGLGNNDNQNIPQLVEFFKDRQIKEIICGSNYTFAITDTDVYSWGYNYEGQLGLGNNINQNIPQLIEFFKDKQIKKIKCGGYHIFAITENGNVYSWGFNIYGQLGLGHYCSQYIPQLVEFFKDKQIKEIKCGRNHTFAITINGNVYSWGENSNGQLGLGHNNSQNIPQQVDFFKEHPIFTRISNIKSAKSATFKN